MIIIDAPTRYTFEQLLLGRVLVPGQSKHMEPGATLAKLQHHGWWTCEDLRPQTGGDWYRWKITEAGRTVCEQHGIKAPEVNRC